MKTKFLLICLMLQSLFVGSAFAQSLVPLAQLPGHIYQKYGFGDMIYMVAGPSSLDQSLYAYDITTDSEPKKLLSNIRQFPEHIYVKFIETGGKLYALATTTESEVHIYEIKGQTTTLIHKTTDRHLVGAWVTDDRKKVYMSIYSSGGIKELFYYDLYKKQGQLLLTGFRTRVISEAAISGNNLLFGKLSDKEGHELWISDGSKSGTRLLKDIVVGSDSGSPEYFSSFNNRVYYHSYNALRTNYSMYWTDGDKVELLTGSNSKDTLEGFRFIGSTDQFAFFRNGVKREIRALDKKHNLETICTNCGLSTSNIVNNKLYFGWGEKDEAQLYVSDGTLKGTKKVSDMKAPVDGSNITQIIQNRKKAIFLHRNNKESNRWIVDLWESDGSSKGTKMLIDSIARHGSDRAYSKTIGTSIITHKGNIYLSQSYFNERNSSGSILHKVSNKATKIKFLAFIDEDADGEKDASEITVNDLELNIGSNKLKVWTNEDGMINIDLDPGKYAISSPATANGWKISGSDSSGLQFELPKDQGKTIYIAVRKTTVRYENKGLFGHARQRCNFVVPFWLNVRNTGTVTSDIEMKLVLDSQVIYDSSSVSPDSLDTASNCVIWKFADVKPFRNQRVKLFAKMPGVNSSGDKLHYTLYLNSKEGGVLKYSDTIKVEDSLGCSYDPNDKQVFPQRELGGVYKEEQFKYKVRFQNTGNDTAINVKLVDTLSQNLDWGSLKILGSSHPVETQLTDGGVLTFFFDDIYLADSNINEPESHGFVDYRIKQKENLKLGDEIKNTAYIYFDFNPAIITNTTYNILVKPSGLADEVTGDDLIEIYPNPMDNQLNIRFENVADRQIEISNSVGMMLHTTTSDAEQIQLETSQWSTGIYLIKVLEGKNTKVFKVIKE